MDHDTQTPEVREEWKAAPYESKIMPKDALPDLPPMPSLQKYNAPKKFLSNFLFIFGVLLPVIALAVELTTEMCAQDIFDPLPTPFHIFLVAFVPVSNWFLWYALWKEKTEYLSVISVTNAATIGIATFYTLVFLPITPIGVFAIIFFGLGFLPLTPILSLIAALLGRRKLKQLNLHTVRLKMPHFVMGFSLGLLGLVIVELPVIVTRVGLQMASSPEIETSNRGVKWLRKIGSKDQMLRNCYQAQEGMGDLISLVVAMGNPVTTDEARNIYYRVTGDAFNSVKPPTKVKKNIRRWNDEFEFDNALGGTSVAGQVKGLSLSTSRQDQSIDANAAVSYTEWTLVFRNSHRQQREARAQIALPPGGVVSRLTLWVNGEEREAAFAGRGKVREAYQKVAVQQRRDPVLVTTSGIDRVLMQCFPVPSNGEMKVRLGITAPLQLESAEQATLPLPYLLERNFGIGDDSKHYVWIESKQPLAATVEGLNAEQIEGGKFALRGNIAEAKLSEGMIRVTRTNTTLDAWAHDTLPKNADVVTQHIAAQPVAAPARVVFVMDGSLPMKTRAAAISDTLAKLPNGLESQLLLAADGVADLSHGVQKITPQNFANLLAGADYAGGNDNLPALLRAWDSAAEKPNSAIVWVHGAQPVEMQGVDELRQRYERRPNGPRIYDVQLIAGPNRLAEKMEDIKAVENVPHRLAGLGRLVATWNGSATRYVTTREKRKQGNISPATMIEASPHLARLWAHDEVKKMLATRDKTADAINLAASYQLVTSVTGAVVLETKEQYERAGLEPVDPNSVPTIPEPETWALIFVVGTILLWLLYQQRGKRQQI